MMAMVATGSFHTTSALAQDAASTPATTSAALQDIDWQPYARKIESLSSTDLFYIYDVNSKKFISTGGQYGVQPISAESGMEFSVEKADEIKTGYYNYYIKSNVINGEEGTGDCLGVKEDFDGYDQFTDDDNTYYVPYIDRGKDNNKAPDRVKWNYEATNTNEYIFYSTWNNAPHYLSYYKASKAGNIKQFYVEGTQKENAAHFYLITKDDYNKVINDKSTVYINVSNMIKDGRFERMNKTAGTFTGGYWKDKLDENGNPIVKKDDKGDPIVKKDEHGDIVKDEKGNPVYEHEQDWVDEEYADGAWVWSDQHHYSKMGDGGYDKTHKFFINDQRYISGDILAYGTAWIGQEDQEQQLYQEIKNIPAGYYRVNCQGFHTGEGDVEAYLFAKNSSLDIYKEVRLRKLTAEDKAEFDKITLPVSGLDTKMENMFKAGKFLANSNPYQDGNKYTNSVYVKIEALNTDGTGNLTLGLRKKGDISTAGDAYVDNFQLFYCGNTEWYLNAANTNPEQKSWKEEATNNKSISTEYANEGINKDKSEYPVRYNLRRKFDVKKWNTFIVPFDIPGDQVKTAFSGDKKDTQVKVSEFDKINELSDHIQILFKKVDLAQDGIKANKPYIIWVGKDTADVATKNDNYSFEYGANVKVSVTGPIYHIDGVTPTTFSSEVTTTTNGVTFQGYYYKPASGAPAGSYILANGTMYHLTKAYTGANFVGTCWYMQNTATDAAGNAKPITFSFEGDGTTTAINGITLNEGETNTGKADGYIYNLSGQRVGGKDSFSSLKPGVYIKDGKKILKK